MVWMKIGKLLYRCPGTTLVYLVQITFLMNYFFSFMTFPRQDKESGLAGHIDHNVALIGTQLITKCYQFFIIVSYSTFELRQPLILNTYHLCSKKSCQNLFISDRFLALQDLQCVESYLGSLKGFWSQVFFTRCRVSQNFCWFFVSSYTLSESKYDLHCV